MLRYKHKLILHKSVDVHISCQADCENKSRFYSGETLAVKSIDPVIGKSRESSMIMNG